MRYRLNDVKSDCNTCVGNAPTVLDTDQNSFCVLEILRMYVPFLKAVFVELSPTLLLFAAAGFGLSWALRSKGIGVFVSCTVLFFSVLVVIVAFGITGDTYPLWMRRNSSLLVGLVATSIISGTVWLTGNFRSPTARTLCIGLGSVVATIGATAIAFFTLFRGV